MIPGNIFTRRILSDALIIYRIICFIDQHKLCLIIVDNKTIFYSVATYLMVMHAYNKTLREVN